MSEIVTDLQERAKQVTVETLNDFIKEIVSTNFDNNNELSSILAIAGIAATQAMRVYFNQMPNRAQDIKIALDYILGTVAIDCPLKLILYDEMLFPQYGFRFEKTIPISVFDYLQDRARFILNDAQMADKLPEELKEHLESITRGCIPFDYKVVE